MADEELANEEETAIDRLARSVEALATQDEALPELVRTEVQAAVAALANNVADDGKEHRAGATDRMIDPYTREGYERGDFELALMIQDGARQMQGPVEINYNEEFTNAARYYIHEDPQSQRTRVVNEGQNMSTARAMDTAESGFGSQLIGAQYVNDLWRAARNLDSIVGDIRDITMTDPTTYVPIDGALPEMLFVGESTSASASNYTTSKTASNRVTLSAKKFTIQQVWSTELSEDSIIEFTPFLREQLAISAAAHLGSAYYNGDTTNAGTGNINSDDADPDDTKHYLAWDGIRHDFLVSTTGNGKSMAAALDLNEILVARGKLNGTDDDIDSAVGNINWGQTASDLRLVCDWDTFMVLVGSDLVTTVDKYGANATIVTGELGRIYGIPIISPGYASKTEADGKASGTETNNTLGQITLFNPRGYLAGTRRESQFFMDRIQRTDQLLIEVYTRKGFVTRSSTAPAAAGIYNITV